MSTIFKDINRETDVMSRQELVNEKLFETRTTWHKPFVEANDTILRKTTEKDGLGDFHTEVTFYDQISTGRNLFSYAVADKAGTDGFYQSLVSQLGDLETHKSIGGATPFDVEKMDVIVVGRDFRKDRINPESFFVVIDGSTGTEPDEASDIDFFDDDENIRGLFPSDEVRFNKLGEFRYLYHLDEAFVYYISETDTIIKIDKSNLGKVCGEVYLDSGLIILYTDIIEKNFIASPSYGFNSYFGGIGGISQLQTNRKTYFLRGQNSEFNHSNNPTFFEEEDKTVIKEYFIQNPQTFITKCGMFNSKNELIAYGTLTKPIHKTPEKELSIRADLISY